MNLIKTTLNSIGLAAAIVAGLAFAGVISEGLALGIPLIVLAAATTLGPYLFDKFKPNKNNFDEEAQVISPSLVNSINSGNRNSRSHNAKNSLKPAPEKIKLLIAGDSGTGKTQLFNSFDKNEFNKKFIPTIGIDFFTTPINTQEISPEITKIDTRSPINATKKSSGKIKVDTWDMAGDPRFQTIRKAYYSGAHAILLVYAVNEEKSFNNVRNWIKAIKKDNEEAPIILVANKTDKADKRVISTEQGQALANKYGFAYIETSAKQNNNVAECFMLAIRSALFKLGCISKDPALEIDAALTIEERGSGPTT